MSKVFITGSPTGLGLMAAQLLAEMGHQVVGRLAGIVRHQHVAPYVLTALIEKPQRLVYLSSGMHRSARLNIDDLNWVKRTWCGAEAYTES